MKRPVIAVTMGDPAGVGPEICLHMLNEPRVLKACTPVVLGNSQVLEALSRRLRVPFSAEKLHPDDAGRDFAPTKPAVIDTHVMGLDDFIPGRMDPVCGHAAYGYILYAVDGAMAGSFDAVATAPICKESLNAAGLKYPGHTEILAERTHSPGVVMMLTSPRVTVSLVTTHVALRDVPRLITRRNVERTITLTNEMTAKLLGRSPRLGVLALNCHAGEGNLFGDEERRAIRPAVEAAKKKGILASGPLPPDSAFTKKVFDSVDAYVCMYHDQGLIPFKMLSFMNGVNVTLGIPIIRTSVDHGTAFDIAWKGVASPKSMIAAVLLATKLAARRG